MKKKIVVSVLAVILTLSCVALAVACVNTNTKTYNLTLWHYYNNKQLAAFNAAVDDFNATVGKEKHIFVKPTSMGYVNDIAQQVVASANNDPGSKAMPNMFMAYADTAYTVDKLEKVAALDDYFTPDELSEYVADFIDEGRFDGSRLKIFPIAKSTEILMLNKTDWDAFAALTPDVSLDDLSTVEGIISVAEKYYDYSGGKAFYGRDSLSNYFIVGAKSLGIDFMYRDADGNFAVNFDKTVMRRLWDGYYVPFVKGYFTADSRFRSTDVNSGKILAYTGSTTSSLSFPDNVLVDDDISYPISAYTAKAPVFKGGERVSVQQGAGLVVTKSDAKTEQACVEFLKWFTSSDVNASFSASSAYMPVKKAALSNKYLNSVQGLDSRCYNALKVSEDIIADDALYTNIPSEYSNNVRNVLDKHIENRAKRALADYAAALERGKSRAEALAPLISDAAFENWLASFEADVKAVYA